MTAYGLVNPKISTSECSVSLDERRIYTLSVHILVGCWEMKIIFKHVDPLEKYIKLKIQQTIKFYFMKLSGVIIGFWCI